MEPINLTALTWKKSSRSTQENCVEVAKTANMTVIRDSKDPAGPAMVVTSRAFEEFLRSLP